MSYPIVVYVIKSGQQGRGVIPVTVPYDSTVEEVLRAAGITVGHDEEVRLNGQLVSLSKKVNAGQKVSIEKKVITVLPRPAGGTKD